MSGLSYEALFAVVSLINSALNTSNYLYINIQSKECSGLNTKSENNLELHLH